MAPNNRMRISYNSVNWIGHYWFFFAFFSPHLSILCICLALLSPLLRGESCLTLWDPMDYIVHGILQGRILEWVAFLFSRGSSQPRDQTQVSHIAGGYFTSWATSEAQEYYSGQPVPSPVDLPDPGIESGSPASQADSLPAELPGKPNIWYVFILEPKIYGRQLA